MLALKKKVVYVYRGSSKILVTTRFFLDSIDENGILMRSDPSFVHEKSFDHS